MPTPHCPAVQPAHAHTHALRTLSFSLAALAVLSGCAAYEAPKPGVHRAPGDPKPEVVCTTENVPGTRFASTRCVTRADMDARGANDRETADNIRTPPPDIR